MEWLTHNYLKINNFINIKKVFKNENLPLTTVALYASNFFHKHLLIKGEGTQ